MFSIADASKTSVVTPSIAKPTHLFFGSLAAVTLLPLIVLGIAGVSHTMTAADTPRVLAILIGITGLGHVSATTYLYADPGFRPIMASARIRFFLVPLVLASGCYALSLVAPDAWKLAFAAFVCWQIYHSQRQNYGIIAFAAQSAQIGRLPREISWMLNSSVASAASVTVLPAPWGAPLGFVFLGAATAILAITLFRSRRLRGSPLVLGFVLLGWVFYFPALFTSDPLLATWAVGIGHGGQYLIFLAAAAGGARAPWLRGVTILASMVLATWLAMTWLNTVALPAYIGLTMAHFLIDAKVWRMREPLQRALIRDRFAFLFA